MHFASKTKKPFDSSKLLTSIVCDFVQFALPTEPCHHAFDVPTTRDCQLSYATLPFDVPITSGPICSAFAPRSTRYSGSINEIGIKTTTPDGKNGNYPGFLPCKIQSRVTCKMDFAGLETGQDNRRVIVLFIKTQYTCA